MRRKRKKSFICRSCGCDKASIRTHYPFGKKSGAKCEGTCIECGEGMVWEKRLGDDELRELRNRYRYRFGRKIGKILKQIRGRKGDDKKE